MTGGVYLRGGLGYSWLKDLDLVACRSSSLQQWKQDDSEMSSSRYWPPTSPEELKKRVEEASVREFLELMLILELEEGVEMVTRRYIQATSGIHSGWSY